MPETTKHFRFKALWRWDKSWGEPSGRRAERPGVIAKINSWGLQSWRSLATMWHVEPIGGATSEAAAFSLSSLQPYFSLPPESETPQYVLSNNTKTAVLRWTVVEVWAFEQSVNNPIFGAWCETSCPSTKYLGSLEVDLGKNHLQPHWMKSYRFRIEECQKLLFFNIFFSK